MEPDNTTTRRRRRSSSRSDTDHDLGDIWTEVRRHGETVAKLHIENQSLADALSDIRQEVRSELREIRTIISRPQQPTNWVGIGSLCVAILIAGGTYANSVMQPVNDKANQNLSWIQARSQALVEDYRRFGELEAHTQTATATLLDHQKQMNSMIEKVGKNSASIQMQDTWLRSMDHYGTRRMGIEPERNP